MARDKNHGDMGFKELETFNLGLLTKMVALGLYFEHNEFTNAKRDRGHHGVGRVCLQVEM